MPARLFVLHRALRTIPHGKAQSDTFPPKLRNDNKTRNNRLTASCLPPACVQAAIMVTAANPTRNPYPTNKATSNNKTHPQNPATRPALSRRTVGRQSPQKKFTRKAPLQ